MAHRRLWLIFAIAGPLVGLTLLTAVPRTAASHLGLIITIAAPILAYYRLMKPMIGKRHCPARPDWNKR